MKKENPNADKTIKSFLSKELESLAQNIEEVIEDIQQNIA